jgi:hypothetical protein
MADLCGGALGTAKELDGRLAGYSLACQLSIKELVRQPLWNYLALA